MNNVKRQLFYRMRDKNWSDIRKSLFRQCRFKHGRNWRNLSNYEYLGENNFGLFFDGNLILKRIELNKNFNGTYSKETYFFQLELLKS